MSSPLVIVSVVLWCLTQSLSTFAQPLAEQWNVTTTNDFYRVESIVLDKVWPDRRHRLNVIVQERDIVNEAVVSMATASEHVFTLQSNEKEQQRQLADNGYTWLKLKTFLDDARAESMVYEANDGMLYFVDDNQIRRIAVDNSDNIQSEALHPNLTDNVVLFDIDRVHRVVLWATGISDNETIVQCASLDNLEATRRLLHREWSAPEDVSLLVVDVDKQVVYFSIDRQLKAVSYYTEHSDQTARVVVPSIDINTGHIVAGIFYYLPVERADVIRSFQLEQVDRIQEQSLQLPPNHQISAFEVLQLEPTPDHHTTSSPPPPTSLSPEASMSTTLQASLPPPKYIPSTSSPPVPSTPFPSNYFVEPVKDFVVRFWHLIREYELITPESAFFVFRVVMIHLIFFVIVPRIPFLLRKCFCRSPKKINIP